VGFLWKGNSVTKLGNDEDFTDISSSLEERRRG